MALAVVQQELARLAGLGATEYPAALARRTLATAFGTGVLLDDEALGAFRLRLSARPARIVHAAEFAGGAEGYASLQVCYAGVSQFMEHWMTSATGKSVFRPIALKAELGSLLTHAGRPELDASETAQRHYVNAMNAISPERLERDCRVRPRTTQEVRGRLLLVGIDLKVAWSEAVLAALPATQALLERQPHKRARVAGASDDA